MLELDPSSQVLRPVTERWADISKQALARHRDQGHIVKKLALATKAAEVTKADDLLDETRKIKGAMGAIYKEARDSGDPELALKALRDMMKGVELLAKLAGQLKDSGVNITINQGADAAMLARLIDAGLCPGCRGKIVEMERAVTGEWRSE